MSFKIAARTILHLGRDLISTDAVALFELVKNALDARSPTTTIRIKQTFPFDTYTQLRSWLRSDMGPKWAEGAVTLLTEGGFKHEDAVEFVEEHESIDALVAAIDELNYIKVADAGHGMSLEELDNVYLVVGTPHRALEQQSLLATDEEPIHGEKGIGRLSVMRLGRRLRVLTSRSGEVNWNTLRVNWDVFDTLTTMSIDQVPVEPEVGPKKENPSEAGTEIHISGLLSDWSRERLEEVARTNFHRFVDPFETSVHKDIRLFFNEERVFIPRFSTVLFDQAHAKLSAQYSIGPSGPSVSGLFTYMLSGHVEDPFTVDALGLRSAMGTDLATLRRLGPFNVELYWYNRPHLKSLEGIGNVTQVRLLVKEWAGGLALYRDGVRVLPYAMPDDDWLNLDPKAFGAPGYKMNRAQIIGRVTISRHGNPGLIDKSNREGLRDTPESRIFVAMLKWMLQKRFRPFLDRAQGATSGVDDSQFRVARQRAATQAADLKHHVKQLLRKFPGIRRDTDLYDGLQHGVRSLKELADTLEVLETTHKDERGKLLNLAGIGMMVEIVAHELNRTSMQALRQLQAVDAKSVDAKTGAALRILKAQLQTLQKRLQILAPMATAARQVKKNFDLLDLCQDVLDAHSAQFERHGVDAAVSVKGTERTMRVKAVKGMIVQILENLIANSVYWLAEQSKDNRTAPRRISIELEPKARELRFSDTGPGISPAESERVFDAFYSTKRGDNLSGLGLYVSRDIAKYHGMVLYLREPTHERCDTFVLGPFDIQEG